MGTSKLMGERLMTAANANLRGEGPVFTSTRFGNVLGSRGSVIPLFREQIRRGGPVTLTDPEMTRFIMSIAEAVRLVIDSAEYACGGEVFITKMPVIRIKDLALAMIQEMAPVFGHNPEEIRIDIVGVKPGEKMYEELMNLEETRRTWELERYFVALPAFKNLYNNIKYTYSNVVSRDVTNPYHSGSELPLSRDSLVVFLKENGLLTTDDGTCPMV
jgi:FlaA1/EpsC-like NDP-sugar epimerase